MSTIEQSPRPLPPHPAPPDSYRPGTAITTWNPEDAAFWERSGKRVAARNLWLSTPTLLLAFVVWQVWSVTVTELNDAGFHLSTSQTMWLTAIPGLTGGTARAAYTFMGPIVGNRRFTVLSTVVLVLPLTWLGFAVRDSSTPYWELCLIAAVSGIAGGNFASSMANIGFFYPKAKKGYANGINAGLSNLGVCVVQLLVPIVTTWGFLAPVLGGGQTGPDGTTIWLQNAAFIWIPLLLAMSALCWFGMNDLKVSATPFARQKIIFRRKHNWLMTLLYVGTFGSFIGFAAALPNLINSTWTPLDPGHTAAAYAWTGPFIGAATRPFGGWISDRLGGARVTLLSFLGMGTSLVLVITAMPEDGAGGNWWQFYLGFLAAFLFAGLGCGSTFRQIPVIFTNKHLAVAAGRGEAALERARRQAAVESSAVTGFSSAVAAYGFFLVPAMFALFSVTGALWGFIGLYAVCLVVCHHFYARKGAEAPS
ncbi:MFS transporter [Streptomyces sp. NPDC017056]|uniref:MFS transporter n=1 Tax=Streptomyces sp. NPDC017056 TaxID=3364973 RepID=UPI0037BC0D7A